MTSILNVSRRFWWVGGIAVALAAAAAGPGVSPALAHETKCPYCKLDVVQDTAEQDNEVALRYGRKRIEYRCVYCALAQAKSTYKGDVTILAPSEVKGKPVMISRAGDKWSVTPETAVFVAVPGSHQQCQTRYRAFSGRAGLDAHVKKNAELLKDAKPLTLAEMVSAAK